MTSYISQVMYKYSNLKTKFPLKQAISQGAYSFYSEELTAIYLVIINFKLVLDGRIFVICMIINNKQSP